MDLSDHNKRSIQPSCILYHRFKNSRQHPCLPNTFSSRNNRKTQSQGDKENKERGEEEEATNGIEKTNDTEQGT
ncbi:hypothetical protein PoB_000595600 [Plakobranchus ocellatus]|uniref:Uncharacterized protein n=1 Tax=Plakobranchus ocellatus TaxID=259542 RepID=A0AAV3YAM6_9GAST|nr:hypothetical protein PoB_000595600 [Plakobranchus ocellatus]